MLKQSYIKQLVKNGCAFDVTNKDVTHLLESGYEVLGVSSGVYGVNGCVVRAFRTGTLFAVTARSSNLFKLV